MPWKKKPTNNLMWNRISPLKYRLSDWHFDTRLNVKLSAGQTMFEWTNTILHQIVDFLFFHPVSTNAVYTFFSAWL